MEYIDVNDFKAGGKFGPALTPLTESLSPQNIISIPSEVSNSISLSSNMWTELLD